MLTRWAQVLSKGSGDNPVEFVFSFDAEDVMASREVSQRIGAILKGIATFSVCIGPKTRTKVQAINADIPRSEWDLLLVTSDDMWPLCNAPQDTLTCAAATAPDDDRAFLFYDGYRKDGLATIPVMTRKYYDRFNYIYHPSYQSVWCDNEWTDVANALGRLVVVDRSIRILEHRHPTNDRSQYSWDDLYRRNEAKALYDIDRNNYEARRFVSKPPMGFTIPTANRSTPLLTVCIATLSERAASFEKLRVELHRQILLLDDPTKVEVLWDCDDGQQRIGAKRQKLLLASTGKFVCFHDDDDEPAPVYIPRLVSAIDAHPNVDAICFKGVFTYNGTPAGDFDFDLVHQTYKNIGDDFLRTPNHLCPIRRELALRVGFDRTKTKGEDSDYALRIFPLLRSQVKIDEVLYHYKFSTSLSRTQRPQDVERYGGVAAL